MGEIMVRVQRLAALEVFGNRAARRVALVGLFATLTAVGAYVAVPLPFTPVPVTLQTMVVILAGVLLGPSLGAASQVTYLVAAAAGAPFFSAGAAGFAHLFGPTGGYLLAFPVAAAIAGKVAGGAAARGSLLGTVRLGAGLALGAATILVGGAAQLALLTGGLENAVRLGIVPFLLGDGLKVVGALLVASRLRTRTLGPS
jgi:biotin transport system substrate-specific component